MKKRYQHGMALAMCLSLLCGCAASGREYTAQMPKTVKYSDDNIDAWSENKQELANQYEGYADDMDPFYEKMTSTLLAKEENGVVSPLNLYMAMGMLAKTSAGQTQAQILDVLNQKDADALEKKVDALWLATYSDDGRVTSRLANSLWLDEGFQYKEATLKALADDFHASSMIGKMGSDAFNERLHTWMNENTGDLLKKEVADVNWSDQTRLGLVSTLYYQNTWTSKFDATQNTHKTFHGRSDEKAEFMHGQMTVPYVKTDAYEAIALPMDDGARMWLYKPVDSPNAVWSERKSDEGERRIVDVSLPKFDVAATMQLKDAWKALGITDVFDASKADFSPLSDEDLVLSSVEHGARVKVDESGVEGGAYTVMSIEATSLIEEEPVDFTLDRPFAFTIESADGSLLFAGQVYSLDA